MHRYIFQWSPSYVHYCIPKQYGDAMVVNGGQSLSASWNTFIKNCLPRHKYVILLNDDIQISHNFAHLIDAMKQGPSTVYSCVSNAAPWGNYIHQQEYQASPTAIWKLQRKSGHKDRVDSSSACPVH